MIFHINFLLVDSDDNNVRFKFWNFSMKFHLLGFTKELGFGLSTSFTRLILFLCFLDDCRFFKELAGTACYGFEAFSRRDCILLE